MRRKNIITVNTQRSITVKKASQIEGNWQAVTSRKTYICGSTLVQITARHCDNFVVYV